jgi:hypothetical protein
MRLLSTMELLKFMRMSCTMRILSMKWLQYNMIPWSYRVLMYIRVQKYDDVKIKNEDERARVVSQPQSRYRQLWFYRSTRLLGTRHERRSRTKIGMKLVRSLSIHRVICMRASLGIGVQDSRASQNAQPCCSQYSHSLKISRFTAVARPSHLRFTAYYPVLPNDRRLVNFRNRNLLSAPQSQF